MIKDLSIFLSVFAILLATSQAVIYLDQVRPNSLGQIQHIFFMQDKNQIFFTQNDHSILGYIQIYSGQVTRVYAYSPNDKLVRINKQANVVQFLSEQNQIYFFDFEEEIKQIKAGKYKIKSTILSFAYLQLIQQLYVLEKQSQRLVYYDSQNLQGNQIYKLQEGEILHQVVPFYEVQTVALVYSRRQPNTQKICIRKFRNGQLLQHNCLNAHNTDIKKVQRNGQFIQIQTSAYNYIVLGSALIKVSRKVVQSFNSQIVLDNFSTYRLFSKAYYDYLVVEAPNCYLVSFKVLDKQKSWGLYKDNTFLRKLKKEDKIKPYRSWIHQKSKSNNYLFIYQSTDNQVLFYDISDENTYLEGTTETQKWRIKGSTKQVQTIKQNDL